MARAVFIRHRHGAIRDRSFEQQRYRASGLNLVTDIDVYRQIEGINGESRDAGYPDWMECVTVDICVHQPKSAATSSSRHTVGRCHHDMVVIGRLRGLGSGQARIVSSPSSPV